MQYVFPRQTHRESERPPVARYDDEYQGDIDLNEFHRQTPRWCRHFLAKLILRDRKRILPLNSYRIGRFQRLGSISSVSFVPWSRSLRCDQEDTRMLRVSDERIAAAWCISINNTATRIPCEAGFTYEADHIGLATRWSSLPTNDKIRNHLLANPTDIDESPTLTYDSHLSD